MALSEKFLNLAKKNPDIIITDMSGNSDPKVTAALTQANPTIDGITFDSAFEAQRYLVLQRWQTAKLITDLTTQHIDKGKKQENRVHRWILTPGTVDYAGNPIQPVYYIDDFQYKIDGILIVEDAKGWERRTFINKRKQFMALYPNINFFVNFDLAGWFPTQYPERWEQQVRFWANNG